MENNNNPYYKHYLSIDWSQQDVSIARMRAGSNQPETKVFPADIKKIKEYLKGFQGKKILTIEETTGSHWLYVELLESVDKILICDPYRNSLLKEGAKNDKIDARKLCLLLRSGLLKEVYHTSNEDYKIRKLASAYIALVKSGVRIKNQNSALYRGEGLKYKKDKIKKGEEILSFVEGQQKRAIKLYEEEKKKYEEVFKELKKKNEVIKMLCQVSGIKETSGVKIYSVVIDARRFENKYKYWAMCGLVKHDRESGGKNYGKKNPRYSRILKNVYKSAALAAIGGNNDIREYYEVLLQKGYPIAEAKNQIARYIAKVTYAVMKNKKPYKAYQWRELNKQKS
jgi:transposase